MNERLLEEMASELAGVAKKRQTITYGELARKLRLGPRSRWHQWIWEYLDDINRRETSEGRPMLTAVVVTEETGMPGPGFWKCARFTCKVWDGKGDPEDFWKRELQRVWDYWAKR
jgi:hypothetical protein